MHSGLLPECIGYDMIKAAFNKKKAHFTNKMDLELGEKLVKFYVRNIAVYGAENMTFRAVDQEHMECFEIWCWRRKE
jgi:hypothetical protein